MMPPLKIFRCDCGFGSVLERIYCPRCRGYLHKAETGADGVILSWTVLHTAGEGFEAPLALAIVGLESGINIMARFDPAASMQVGEKVVITVDENGLRWASVDQ